MTLISDTSALDGAPVGATRGTARRALSDAPRVAVLGAGITGVTTAYALHARGYDVTVIDRQRYAGMETSFANGGQLSASNAETWTQWSTVLKGLRWMLQRDAPLSVSPRPSLAKAAWMARFLAAIPRYAANTTETARLAIAARGGLAEMAETAGIEFDFSRAGILHFYESEREMAHARRVSGLLAAGGLHREELSGAQVLERCPQLHATPVGGTWTPSDSTGDIHRFTAGLAAWLAGQGVAFDMGAPVTEARADGGRDGQAGVWLTYGTRRARFDACVVCAGVGSASLARKFGDSVGVYPVKGYSITVELRDATSRAGAPTVSLLDDHAKIVTSRLGDGRFRVAGTAEIAGENRDIRADRIAPLTDWVAKRFPQVCTEHCVPWAGLRPMMPDMMPRVGPGRRAGVFYNTGHGHLGWTLGPATAQIVADAVAAAHPARRSVGLRAA